MVRGRHNGISKQLVTEWIARRPRWSCDASRRRAGSQRGISLSDLPSPPSSRWISEVRVSGTPSSPQWPISDYSYRSCWFKSLNCSFCSAMLHQMRSMIFTGLYDVMCAALYMQHLVWFDVCFLHGFPLKQPGILKIAYTLTCLGLSLQGYKALGVGIHTQGNEGITPPHHHAINTHTTHSWTSTLWGHSLRGCARGGVGRKG